jgi:hypothetical protein
MRNYRVRIAKEGSEFEVEGDKGFVLEMLKRFQVTSTEPLSLPTPTTRETHRRAGKGAASGKQIQNAKTLSIREFVQKLGFTKHTDITLAFGYYLEKHSGVSDFTPADINTCYYEAKLDTSNTSQMIIQNIKRGHIMESKTRGGNGKNKYTLTSSGEQFIDSKLSGNS